MGAVDELDAHQGVLGAEDLGVDLIQGVPTQVVIAVPSGAGEVGFRHSMVLEGGQHLLAVVFRHGVDVGELSTDVRFRLACHI